MAVSDCCYLLPHPGVLSLGKVPLAAVACPGGMGVGENLAVLRTSPHVRADSALQVFLEASVSLR